MAYMTVEEIIKQQIMNQEQNNSTEVAAETNWDELIPIKDLGLQGDLAPGKSLIIKWKMKDGIKAEDVIDNITPGCSCTKDVQMDGQTIIAKQSNTDNRVGVQTKTLTVYFKDGLNEKVKTDRGVLKWPGNKAKATLQFKVNQVK